MRPLWHALLMIEIESVTFDGDNQACIRGIRSAVFGAEQGVPTEVDFDGLDPVAAHVLARLDGKPAGTGRILDDGHIGRIAVRPEFRSSGLGAAIVGALLDEARVREYPRVFLGAQTHAIGFYRKLGFSPFGDEYREAGIQHIAMELFFDAGGDC